MLCSTVWMFVKLRFFNGTLQKVSEKNLFAHTRVKMTDNKTFLYFFKYFQWKHQRAPRFEYYLKLNLSFLSMVLQKFSPIKSIQRSFSSLIHWQQSVKNFEIFWMGAPTNSMIGMFLTVNFNFYLKCTAKILYKKSHQRKFSQSYAHSQTGCWQSLYLL